MIYFILVIYVTKVYIVRHCETDGNALKIFQGHTDMDINELGSKQLVALENKFKKINLDAVYTSPLMRAQKTAKAVLGEKKIPLITDDGLIEINGGVYEGRTYQELRETYEEFGEMWQFSPWKFAPENGETMPQAYERIWNTVSRIVKENKDKSIAIISHGFVIRSLFCKIMKDDPEKFCEIPFGTNTSVSLLEFENKIPTITYLNDASHLTEELVNKKAKVPIK